VADTTGRLLLAAGDTQEWLRVEQDRGAGVQHVDLDDLLGRLAGDALRGRSVIRVTAGRLGEPSARLTGLSAGERTLLDERFTLAKQQARGAWYIPDDVKVTAGLANLASAFASDGLYALVTTGEDTVSVPTAVAADHVFLWAALLPFLSRLVAPVVLRSGLPGAPKAGEQAAAWSETDAYYDAVGLDGGPAYDVMRYGGGWGRLDRQEQHATRQALLAHLAPQVDARLAARHRAYVTAELAAAFYAKAKKETPLARRVLNKRLQPAVSGYFGGDWLAFLNHLGEEPNPSEEMFTTLPVARLYVGGVDRTRDIAASEGLSEATVAEVLASFSGQPTTTSPVEERLAVVREWWKQYDDAHARQTPAMPSLWGLVGSGFVTLGHRQEALPLADAPVRLLSPTLRADIDRLWQRTTLPRWPDRLVVQPHPHRALADLFGTALKFWDGASLTMWFVTEGPTSRTTIDGLETYHADDLAVLDAAGTPVDRRMFADLKAAQTRLGPEQEIRDDRDEQVTSLGNGLYVSVTVGMVRTRRDGFEHLRDVVTRYRREWTHAHLETYLRTSWEQPLKELSRQHHQALAARGRPLTDKQFAARAAPIANAWFGGRLDLASSAIGERAAHTQQDVGPTLPCDITTLSRYVLQEIGGTAAIPGSSAEDWLLTTLAAKTDRYIQLTAARGELATRKDLNVDYTDQEGLPQAWDRYTATVQRALALNNRAIRDVVGTADTPTATRLPATVTRPFSSDAKPAVRREQPSPQDERTPSHDRPEKKGFLGRLFRGRRP